MSTTTSQAGLTASAWLQPVRLAAGPVVLEPLSAAHAPALARAVEDGALWQLWYTTIPRPEDMAATVEDRLRLQNAGTWLAFAVIDAETSDAIGMTNYLNVVASVRRLEIGGTWYRRSAQRTGVNTACKLALLRHAFEVLDCIAVELRTHAFNMQSRRAIEGIGAKLDGILRQHHDPAGNIRDTCVYSIIASEWPTVRRHLEWRLSRDHASG